MERNANNREEIVKMRIRTYQIEHKCRQAYLCREDGWWMLVERFQGGMERTIRAFHTMTDAQRFASANNISIVP
jgi:hypothetical protein